MAEKLKPCPFCGGEADAEIVVGKTEVSTGIGFRVCCPKCRIERSSFTRCVISFEEAEIFKQEVIEAWNRRSDNA